MREVIVAATRTVMLVAMAGAWLSACKSDHHEDGHSHGTDYLDFCTLPPPCRDIVEACHSKDDVSNAEVHECHETAHEQGTESACAAVRDDCVQKCNAAPAPEGSIHTSFGPCDGGASGGHDAGHD
jgi:hypothetical protein